MKEQKLSYTGKKVANELILQTVIKV